MTTIRIEAEHLPALRDLVTTIVRPADVVVAFTDDDPRFGELRWNVDLSPFELAAVMEIRQRLRSVLGLSDDEWTAIRPHLQTLRDLRQMGRNAFMALTAAERDRLLYDALVAQTIVDLAILRD